MMDEKHSQPGLRDAIAFGGLMALVVLFVTASAQLTPDTNLRVVKGMTPLLSAELVRSKTDLEHIFGLPGSANRQIIRDATEFDFMYWWVGFSLLLSVMTPVTRPELKRLSWITILIIIAAGIVRYTVSRHLLAAANAAAFTDAMAWGIRWPSLLSWLLIFTFSIGNSVVFLGGRSEAKVGGCIFILSSLIGILGVAFYDVLIPYAALGLFVGLYGVTIMVLLMRESV